MQYLCPAVRLLSLLAHFSLSFTPPDDSDVASVRRGLLGRLRAAGWPPARAPGDGAEPAWRPPITAARRRDERDEAFLAARIDAYQDVLETMGPREQILLHMIREPSGGLPPTEAEVDAGLLAAFVRGDAAAVDTLIERHAPRLHGQARRWLPAAAAAHAVQDTFMALFERAAALLERGDIKVGGILFTTLRLTILRALDTRYRAWFFFLRLVPSFADSDDGLTALLRRQHPPKLVHHIERECNPLEQEVIALHLEDRSDREIAAELGIPRPHVRVIRNRARAKLRRAL